MHRILARALSVAVLVAAAAAPATHAAGDTLYVDGKNGSDNASGTSPQAALKTIAEAASRVPAGSAAAGWTISVKGYRDFIYRERPIPTDWGRRGTASARMTFQAEGYAPGSSASYIRPIVSGADRAPRSGQGWTRHTTGIWKTPWPDKPFAFGKYTGNIRTAIFQDTTTWLWEQSSLSALTDRAAAKLGGYFWSNGTLYVSGKGTTDPTGTTIDVIMRNAFLFIGTNGDSGVAVRGFEVRHAANGIALTKGVDDSVVADNVLVGNLLMGIQTSGGQTSSGPDAAKRNTIARNSISRSTLQGIKVDEGSQDSSYCDNRVWANGLQGIKVQGPPGGTGYTGSTSGIKVCRNELRDHDFNPSGSQYNNANGLSIANGARSVTAEGNRIVGNDVGVHITQEGNGMPAMTGILLRKNQIWSNRRFGINFYDGAYSTTGGSGSMRSEYDVIWGNGTGVMVARGTSNKTVLHATIHANTADGMRVGESGKAAASVTVSETIFTSNKGYGIWLVTGNKASVKYTGLSGNASGAIKGSPSKTAVNTQRVGYLSTNSSSSSFLRIPTSSYQYTAGPSRSPIGARY
jgi:hypothetical protein